MMIIRDCRLIKPLYCGKDSTVVEAAIILRDNKQRRLIVVDEDKKPIGIISTTDINNKVVAQNKDASKMTIKDIMTSPVYLVADINEEVNVVFGKMLKHETFFVPITEKGKLIGILTYGELMEKANEAKK